MKPRTGARLAWSLWAVFALFGAAGVWIVVLARPRAVVIENLVYLVIFLAIATVGALVASRQPGNAFGWIFLATAMAAAIAFPTSEFAHYSLRVRSEPLPGTVLAAWIGSWAWLPVFTFPTSFVLLLFPDGRLPSRRWRPFAWFVGGFLVVAAVTFMFAPGRLEGAPIPNPVGIGALAPLRDIISVAGYPVILGFALISATSMILRFRRARGEQRQQIKWFTFAAAFLAIEILVSALVGDVFNVDLGYVGTALDALGFLVLPVAAGVAILRYRLYDIDVVINRTVLYGLLAAFITAVYVGIVVGIGALVGSRGNLLLSIVATALIALAFQPVRARARHLANRLVYGKRATPLEVLSEFAERAGGSYGAEDALPRMARIIGEATGAARAEVWLRIGPRLRAAAQWPAGPDGRSLDLDADDLPTIPGADRAYPVRHGDELLGVLAVTKRPGDALTPGEDSLLEGLASQAGLILRNVRLIEELRASRQRIVSAQDHERRRLERNIHDGAQQQLVALSVKLRLLKALAAKDPTKAGELVDQLQAESQDALENLRDLARGIYPPLLADKGLAAALEAQARKTALPVTVEPNGVGRYPQEAEAAAYFCVLEALQNAAKHARASAVTVRLREDDGLLAFDVSDDGSGFDVEKTPTGSGLQNMADRVEALGGSIDIASSPGRGTTITGHIPIGERSA
jgi:signal transduction histidine kinase